ncbi:hypothetical protein Trydic_g20113 [Trypoxylus dichotomus]
MAKSAETSPWYRAHELNISRSTIQLILTKDLHLDICKMQLTQQLKSSAHETNGEFPKRSTVRCGASFFEEAAGNVKMVEMCRTMIMQFLCVKWMIRISKACYSNRIVALATHHLK